MGISTRWTADYAAPTAPVEFADAVEQWARGYGRHATLKYVPLMGCWSVNLSLKPGHPDLKAFQEGRASVEPTEGVLLVEWDEAAGPPNKTTGNPMGEYRAVDLEEYGPSGIVALLERGNTWSGRGEFGSLADAVRVAATRNREEKERIKARLRDDARHLAADQRRQILGIPFVGVTRNLSTEG